MQKLKGLMTHHEAPSQAPEKSSGISRMGSSANRSSNITGEGTHFPRRQPKSGAKREQNGAVPNGGPGGVEGAGKAPSDRIMGAEMTDQEMVARTEKPQFITPITKSAPGEGEAVSEGGPVGGRQAGGGAIATAPIPSTGPKQEPESSQGLGDEVDERAEPGDQEKKPGGGMAAAIAGGAAATVVAAASAVGVHGRSEKESEKEGKGVMGMGEEGEKEKEKEEDIGKEKEEEEEADRGMKGKEEETTAGAVAGAGLGEQKAYATEPTAGEETPVMAQPEPREPQPSLAGAALGQQAGGEKADGAAKETEATSATQKDQSRISGVGVIPGMFPPESEQQAGSEAMKESKTATGGEGLDSGAEQPSTTGETAAAGSGKQAETSEGATNVPKSYAAAIGGSGSGTAPETAPTTSATEQAAGIGGIGQKAEETAAPVTGMGEKAAPSAMETGAAQPTEAAATTGGGGGAGMGAAAGAGAAGVAGLAGGAGIAQKMKGEKPTTGEEAGGVEKSAAEEAEERQLEEDKMQERKAEEEAAAHESKLKQKREELERQKEELERQKEKQKELEREIQEEEEAIQKEKDEKKGIQKEEKGHEKAIGKEEKKREKEAKAREKAEEKERKKQAKQAKRRASTDAEGKKGGGGGLFGFLGRRMSSKGGENGDAVKSTSGGSKAAGKQPMKTETAETETRPDSGIGTGTETQAKGMGTTAAEGTTNDPAPGQGQSLQQPLTDIGEAATGKKNLGKDAAFPKLDAFPRATGGGTVAPFRGRTHSGPQFQANIPTYVTP